MEEPQKRGKVMLSKKLYHVLESKYEDKDLVADILKTLCETIHFDPNVSTYNDAQFERIKARRNRLKEQGVSTYISSGSKASYHNRKALVI